MSVYHHCLSFQFICLALLLNSKGVAASLRPAARMKGETVQGAHSLSWPRKKELGLLLDFVALIWAHSLNLLKGAKAGHSCSYSINTLKKEIGQKWETCVAIVHNVHWLTRSAFSRLSLRLQRSPNRVEGAQTVFGDPETFWIRIATN